MKYENRLGIQAESILLIHAKYCYVKHLMSSTLSTLQNNWDMSARKKGRQSRQEPIYFFSKKSFRVKARDPRQGLLKLLVVFVLDYHDPVAVTFFYSGPSEGLKIWF